MGKRGVRHMGDMGLERKKKMSNQILGYGRKVCATYGRNGVGEREKKMSS